MERFACSLIAPVSDRSLHSQRLSGCTWGRLRVRRTFACIVGAARDVRKVHIESSTIKIKDQRKKQQAVIQQSSLAKRRMELLCALRLKT